ncbi:M56 family metallopeptidase [Larkinella rosea]|uniref:POTRA domain-containing protein n=1 Tax=Larkinella rosea TaxID=2025312 RepID=A0A3P1C383_9BACT|nr:M56 family metallopeptidase [Larkinella rosea]RRB07748.1 hypothetical protein EHT25_08230 [Larkinella rosea]
MLTDLFTYLAQGTVSLTVFALPYRFFFSRLTTFQWNRFYLVGSALLSLLIPFVSMPELVNSGVATGAVFGLSRVGASQAVGELLLSETTAPTGFSASDMGTILLVLYGIGCLYKAARFGQNLRAIFNVIRTSRKIESGHCYSVYCQSRLTTFSFLNGIFLNFDEHSLTEEERAQVLQHERFHVRHRHTLDLLFFEILGIVFWFNPLVGYLSRSIRLVHEYVVDALMTRSGKNVRTYGYLLVKLTRQQGPNSLVHSFSTKPIFLRIHMLTQNPSKPMHKLIFLLILPVLALVTVLCSFLQPAENRLGSQSRTGKPLNGIPIGSISWKGNTVYSTTELNKALDVKPGDLYNKKDFTDRLYNHVGTDVASLYMDKGYLYFNVEVKENRMGKLVNLKLTVFEGAPATIGKVTVKGNKKISAAKILAALPIQPGDLFSRSKLIKSQQILAEMGPFNPTKVGINPIPNHQAKTVDLEYVLVEK